MTIADQGWNPKATVAAVRAQLRQSFRRADQVRATAQAERARAAELREEALRAAPPGLWPIPAGAEWLRCDDCNATWSAAAVREAGRGRAACLVCHQRLRAVDEP